MRKARENAHTAAMIIITFAILSLSLIKYIFYEELFSQDARGHLVSY
jgi:hypothetical protein